LKAPNAAGAAPELNQAVSFIGALTSLLTPLLRRTLLCFGKITPTARPGFAGQLSPFNNILHHRGWSISACKSQWYIRFGHISFFPLFSLKLLTVSIMAATHFKLNTGAEIPALGFGTWQSPKGETKKAVAYALSVGYIHIDCGT
jgi:hypothetical protein